MDIVDRLLNGDMSVKLNPDGSIVYIRQEAAAEIERLRQQNAELVKVLKLALASHGVVLTSDPPQDAWKANGVADKARAALAKVIGGE